MTRITLCAGDVNNGIAFIRLHQIFRRMSQYQIRYVDFENISHTDLLYTDILVMSHPYHETQARLVQRCKSQYKIKVIVDFDDMTDNIMSDHPEYFHFQQNSVPDIVRYADHVVVSTQTLKDHWGHLNPNITVIENMLDWNRYEGATKVVQRYHAGYVVGWTGSKSHQPDLYNSGFIEGLTRFMEENDDVRAYFHLLCPQVLLDKFGSRIIFNPQSCDYLDWPSMCATYPFDVCAVPLYDHPFNHAKSDLRLLDMAPFKIPVIASPVASFINKPVLIVTDWYSSLMYAYNNRLQMAELADKAYAYVQAERDVSTYDWQEVIHQVWTKDQPVRGRMLAQVQETYPVHQESPKDPEPSDSLDSDFLPRPPLHQSQQLQDS